MWLKVSRSLQNPDEILRSAQDDTRIDCFSAPKDDTPHRNA